MSKKLVALYSSLVIGITCMSSFVNANAIYLSDEYCDKKGLIFYDNIIYYKWKDNPETDLGIALYGGAVECYPALSEILRSEEDSAKVAIQIDAYNFDADEKEFAAEGERLSENGVQIVSYEGNSPRGNQYADTNGDVYFAVMTVAQAMNFPASQKIAYALHLQKLPEGLQLDSDTKDTVLAHDVNGDGDIDIMDVITVNKAILGKELLTEEQNIAADVDKNNKVDSNDALLLLKYIVGLITDFNA